MKKVGLSLAAAVALSVSAPAFAADMAVKAPAAVVAAPASPWDIAFGAAVMNDYVFRGITQSNHKPSVAAYFEPRYNVTKDFQLYVGLSGESISFPNRAAAEIDFYGGARWTIGQFVLDGGFWYYYYPGGSCFNLGTPVGAFGADCAANGNLPVNGNVIKKDLSFWEVYFKPTWNLNDQWAFGANFYYTPSFLHSGASGTYISGTAKFTAPANWAIGPFGWYVSGEFGRQYLGTSDSFYGLTNTAGGPGIKYADYNTWNVGFGATWKQFTLDLRYSDTDLSKGNCNAFTSDYTASAPGAGAVTPINPLGQSSNWCSSTFIAKLSVDLTAANLK
jgi:uncharacterized protein (TIGR02001 family)